MASPPQRSGPLPGGFAGPGIPPGPGRAPRRPSLLALFGTFVACYALVGAMTYVASFGLVMFTWSDLATRGATLEQQMGTGGLLALGAMFVAAIWGSSYLAVWLLHAVGMALWFLGRSSLTTIRTPWADILVSAAGAYGLGLLLWEPPFGVSEWETLAHRLGAALGAALGYWLVVVVRRRQAGRA